MLKLLWRRRCARSFYDAAFERYSTIKMHFKTHSTLKSEKKYTASWSVFLSSNIFWMLYHKTSTRIFFKQCERTENLKMCLRLHIYLVIIYCALFATFKNTVSRRLVLPKKFLTVCRRTKHTVFIYKRGYYMFLVPLHDIHFKIIWPEEKNALNRLFCVRNKKF